ncbi:MAG: DUF2092 domain-containing protein [Verrucomicrobiales bacterium]
MKTTFAIAATLFLSLTGCSTFPPGASNIDADARAILRATSAKLAAAQHFSFRARRHIDASFAEGSPLKENADILLEVARPDRVRGASRDQKSTRTFFYDGAAVTLHDSAQNLYATVAAPNTIDKMVAGIHKKWGFSPPLGGLLVSDPYRNFLGKNPAGGLTGEERVRGETCHHLTFTSEEMAWEIWIARSDDLPRKSIITVTALEGHPRSETFFSDWNLDASFPDDYFRAKVPRGATRIEMVPAP